MSSQQVAELPTTTNDNDHLKKSLDALLEEAKDILGEELYKECRLGWSKNQELIVGSCLEAAEALAAVCKPKEELLEYGRLQGFEENSIEARIAKELLKALKKAARDVVLWRSIGNALGLDRLGHWSSALKKLASARNVTRMWLNSPPMPTRESKRTSLAPLAPALLAPPWSGRGPCPRRRLQSCPRLQVTTPTSRSL